MDQNEAECDSLVEITIENIDKSSVITDINSSKDLKEETNKKTEQLIKHIQNMVKNKQVQEGLRPLFLFLTSSLNVELVYVVLHSISQFSLLGFVRYGFTKKQLQLYRRMEYSVNRFGDTTVRLRSYKIKNITAWQETSGKNFFRRSFFEKPDSVANTGSIKNEIELEGFQSYSKEEKSEEVPTQVEVTFHRLMDFMNLFEQFGLTLDLLEQSLSPEFNMEQVFQAGEGAGKSGSFFFFSHDRRFLIKTMS